MKQYRILYKRGRSPNWGTLKPVENEKLYDRPEIAAAVQVLRENPTIEAICVRLDDELFNIVVRILPELESDAFPLED